MPQRAPDLALELLGAIAAQGGRCPSGQVIRDYLIERGELSTDGGTAWTTTLARAGKLRIEVYAKNWRVITLLVGPHAGKSTAAPPRGGVPYAVIDVANGYDTPLEKARRRREEVAAFERRERGIAR